MNRNHQGDKNPQHRMGMDSQSQSRQASGRSSEDLSQGQSASRERSQQGMGRDSRGQQSSQGSDSRNSDR